MPRRLGIISLSLVRQARITQRLCKTHWVLLATEGSFAHETHPRPILPLQGVARFSTAKVLYQAETTPMMEIKFQELLGLLESKSVVLMDVREPKELVEDGKIAGSINVPLGEVESALSLSPDKFESKYGGQLPSREESSKLVVSCRSGKRAAMALDKAKKQGYEDARWYSGSFQDWQANGGPLEKP